MDTSDIPMQVPLLEGLNPFSRSKASRILAFLSIFKTMRKKLINEKKGMGRFIISLPNISIVYILVFKLLKQGIYSFLCSFFFLSLHKCSIFLSSLFGDVRIQLYVQVHTR
jgi:hypothetical protein